MFKKRKSVNKKPVYPRQIYYVPLYCYRHFPSISDVYKYIIRGLTSKGVVNVYSTRDLATKEALSLLCDDDTAGVGELNFTDGYCRIFFDTQNAIVDLDECKHIKVVE